MNERESRRDLCKELDLCKKLVIKALFCASLYDRFSNYSSRLPSTWLAAEGSQYNLVLATPEQVVDHMGIARGLTG